jgi:hypothetical protein
MVLSSTMRRCKVPQSCRLSTNKETWFLEQPQAFLGDRLLLQHVIKEQMSKSGYTDMPMHAGNAKTI